MSGSAEECSVQVESENSVGTLGSRGTRVAAEAAIPS